MNIMHNPPHVGEVLKEIYLDPLDLTLTDTAKALGVSRQALSELVNGKRSLSTEMAMRLSKAFNTSPEMWLNLQTQFDLWRLRNKKFNNVRCLVKKNQKEAA